MGEADGQNDPLDHGRCDHDPMLDDLCATIRLLRRWASPPEDARLRFGPPSTPPGVTESLDEQLADLDDLARRTLGD